MGLTRRGRDMKGKSIVLIAALAAAPLAFTTSAHAGTVLQKCASAKQKAVAKKEAAKLGCYSKAAGKAIAVDPACLMKAEAAFAAAFSKADANGVCEGTESNVEFTIDHCIDLLNGIITGSGKCPAAKLKASGKDAAAKAGCWSKATGKGLPTGSTNPDPTFVACLGKASMALPPAFTKANGSTPCPGAAGDANTTIDNNCIQAVMSQLPPVAPGCGNGIVDPGETCDDGNTVNGDSCPANCIIQSCTVNTGTHQSVSVQLTAPAGVTVGAVTLYLDYPEGNVRIPVTSDPSGVSDGPVNDLSYAFKDPVLDATFVDGLPANGAGPMLHVTFDGCQGQPLPAASDYKCSFLDASDENGVAIDPTTLGCMVTIP